ncbi:MAG: gp436 family protein [Alphaproteobacteria bacterium]
MSYTTKQQMIDRFGQVELVQLTDRGADPQGVIDDAVIERALADADALIDGYLAGRYATPLSPAPALIVQLAADIARYKLFDDRAPEEVRLRFQDAVRTLERLQTGAVTIAAPPPAAPISAAGQPKVESQDRLFSRDRMTGF